MSADAELSLYTRLASLLPHPDPALLAEWSSGDEAPLSTLDLLPLWAEAARRPSPGAQWNLYIHVPFCKSICNFCNYRRLRLSHPGVLETFVTSIREEARLLAPSLQGVRFGALYMGGGTPSVLPARLLDSLLAAIHDCFSFHPRASKTFEFDPLVMNAERFEVLKKYAFTRYSFGVQSLDREVNLRHNRGPQDREQVFRQLDAVRGLNGYVNVDFLLGLQGTTPEGISAEVEEVIEAHQPDEISIYYLWPTREYLTAEFEGSAERFEAHLSRFEAEAPSRLERIGRQHGYRVSASGKHHLRLHLPRRGRRPAGAELPEDYCDVPSQLHRPLYLLGLGDSARSKIFGGWSYAARREFDPTDPGAARYVGRRLDLDDEMFGYLAFMLRDSDEVDRDRFRRTFGKDILEAFDRPLAKLGERGAVQVEARRVRFRAESRQERLRDLLYFLPKSKLRRFAERLGNGGLPRGDAPIDAGQGPAAGPRRRGP